jgi:exopolysaccharide production protein ExoZ
MAAAAIEDRQQRRASSDSAASRELLSIQYLRAVAAIAVLVFHAAQRAGTGFGPGAAGVDIFFVISGFIMWVISARRPPTPVVFLVRRAVRIVPLYWLVTLGVAATAIFVPSLFPHMKPTIGHIARSIFFIPHADPDGDIAPLIVPGWTLNYEIFFYLAFALSLTLAGKQRIRALTAMLGALVVAGLVLHPTTPVLSTYTDPLLLEFLAGVWLGKAWIDGLRLHPAFGIAAMALGLAIYAGVAFAAIDVAPIRLFAWGAPAFLIVAGAIALEPVREWKLPKFLGDASYSIYLVHGLALAFCMHILAALRLETLPIVLIVCVLGGIAVGSACYWFIERPLLRLFHHARRRPMPSPASDALATRVLAGGLAVTPPDAA